MRFALAITVSLVCAAGCGRHSVGVFEADGFYHSLHPYRVRYTSSGSPLGSDWLLENFQVDRSGAYDQPKSGPDYERDLYIDLDNDGEQDEVGKVPRFDLLFRHRRTAAEIWISTVVLPQGDEETDLRVLLERYVEAVSGSGSVTVALDATGRQSTVERRFATRITDGRPTVVGGREAYEATVEVANVDQLHLSPDARWERANIVLVRPNFGWTQPTYTRGRDIWPVILIAGYTSRPADYEAHLADFRGVLGRIEFLNSPDGPLRTASLACAPEADRVHVPLFISAFGGVNDVAISQPALRECLLDVWSDRGERATGTGRVVIHSYYRHPPTPRAPSEPPQTEPPPPTAPPPPSETPADSAPPADPATVPPTPATPAEPPTPNAAAPANQLPAP